MSVSLAYMLLGAVVVGTVVMLAVAVHEVRAERRHRRQERRYAEMVQRNKTRSLR